MLASFDPAIGPCPAAGSFLTVSEETDFSASTGACTVVLVFHTVLLVTLATICFWWCHLLLIFCPCLLAAMKGNEDAALSLLQAKANIEN